MTFKIEDPNRTRVDTVVIGGGPAGCTAATLLAQEGQKVVLLERSTKPTFKIGESLIPGTYWTLKRIGMIEKLKQSHFQKKHSVQFYSSSGRGSAPFYFYDNDPHESSVTWQVLRSEFDQMLLDHAAESGVTVKRGVSARKVLFEGNRASGVEAKFPGGTIRQIQSNVVVDATGQSTLISRKGALKESDSRLKNAAIFTHFRGATRDQGQDEGATLVMHTNDKSAWFWYIPLADDLVSVGVVGPIDTLLEDKRKGLQHIFDNQVEKCLPLKGRIQSAEQVFAAKATKDFSYRSSQVAGDGWVLVGDALGFLDPVYSSGVLLAFQSGEMAADCIIDAWKNNDFSEKRLSAFQDEFWRGMDAFKKLVYAFYNKDFNFARFLKKYPQCKQGVTDILSGNIFKPSVEQIFEPLDQMLS